MGDDNNNEMMKWQAQQQEFEDDLQIVIEKLIHALAIVLRRKIHKWIHKDDERSKTSDEYREYEAKKLEAGVENVKEGDKTEGNGISEAVEVNDYSE